MLSHSRTLSRWTSKSNYWLSINHLVLTGIIWSSLWSMALGRLPHVSRDANYASKPAMVPQLEVASWNQYLENPKPPEIASSQPSNLRSIYKHFCELCEIMHRGMYILYAPQNELNSNHVLDIYIRPILPGTVPCQSCFGAAELYPGGSLRTVLQSFFRNIISIY